ncbi:MAG TPA: glycoside hydrolase family 3 N-terminal domain-containing protein [Bryobacteraceae bacterium]|nr:glycoside hydrolase family 3 N-terminal domain-containing protein [Bryobacteraceae bacterium]
MPYRPLFVLLACCAIVSAAESPADKQSRAVVQRWMKSMSLRDRVAQLISMPCYGENPGTRSADFRRYRHWVRDLRIGGLIVANRVVNGQVRNAEPFAMALFLNRMQRLARVPLLVSSDFERGASMRVANTTKFPYNMAFAAARDLAATRFEGAETARQARALGVHWVFAPDADVNNNPDNPIINTRSYGENPQDVAEYVAAYIDGAHSDPNHRVLVTAKHFPGHGDTAVDTHLGLARLEGDRARLEAVEFVPFKAAIAHGVDAIMTAHMAAPALEPEAIPATVSRNVLTGVLRNELGFNGLIVTDAMDMQGLAKQFSAGEASVRALEAGADVLLMPPDADQAINAVMAAIRQGRLSRQRIDQSVLKVLNAKARVGLARRRVVDVDEISDAIDTPEAEEIAERVAERALTLLRNQDDIFPVKDSAKACLFVLPENRYSQQGRALLLEIHRRAPAMTARALDPAMPDEVVSGLAQTAARSCASVFVAAFDTVGAYRGNVALGGCYPGFLRAVVSAAPTALIAFGNPYLLRSFPDVAGYLATFSAASTSETAVARALFGEIPISGRTPVTIPGFARSGDGIQLGMPTGSK